MDHYIDIVNEKDEVIGRELKSKKPELGFISRVVAVFVMDSNNKVIICQRSPHKKNDPNKFDLSACGNVDAGETYENAAMRELFEETGINAKLTFIDKSYAENIHNNIVHKYFVGIFLANSDEGPKLNHEVVSFRRMTVQEIDKEIYKNPDNFCQGFRNDFNRVKDKLVQVNHG